MVVDAVLSLSTSSNIMCATFSVDDDLIPEGTESFSVSLELPAGAQFQLGARATAIVQILDNGERTARFRLVMLSFADSPLPFHSFIPSLS